MIIAISGKIESGKDTVGKIIQYLTLDDKVFAKTNADIIADLEHNGYCANKSSYQIKKFAKVPKQIVSMLTKIPVEDLEKHEVKNKVLGEEWWYWKVLKTNQKVSYLENKDFDKTDLIVSLIKLTVRQLLQEVATDAMRDVVHPNVWINALFADYNDRYTGLSIFNAETKKEVVRYEENESNWIITDIRFSNELEAVKDRGGISIRVNRFKGELFMTGTGSEKTIQITHEHLSETALDLATFDYVIDNNGTIEELIEKVKEILIKEKII